MFRQVSAESYILPPGQFRRFGSAGPRISESSWIPPIRKDNVLRKTRKATSPSTVKIVEEQKKVEPAAPIVVIEPEPQPDPEPKRAPLALMSRQALGKVLKTARKVAAAKPRAGVSSGGAKHPMMRSSATASTKRRGSTRVKPPKREPRPFILDEAAFLEAAMKALNGFTQRKVFHPIAVMATMLDPRAEEHEHESILIAHAIGILREEVEAARAANVEVNRRLLHAKCARAFGRLVASAWSCFKRAEQYSSRRRARFDIMRLERDEGEIFFLVEPSRRPNVIHVAMGQDRFRYWIKGWDCCSPQSSGAKNSKKRLKS
ncbi:MAG: hypothetical protein ABIO72_00360 [Patescibacteria group bacterium]